MIQIAFIVIIGILYAILKFFGFWALFGVLLIPAIKVIFSSRSKNRITAQPPEPGFYGKGFLVDPTKKIGNWNTLL